MYRSLLVPLDRSSFAEQALPLALSIARRANAGLDLVEAHVLYALQEDQRQQGIQVQARAVVARHPVEAILEEAGAQASNLIALATHGRGGLKRLLLGSVADQLTRAAPSPVLVYRPTGKVL